MLISATYTCAWCGEENDAEADASAGRRQEYVEDCAVCCRPNLLAVTVDADGGGAVIDAARENE